jgi:septum formation inhibitor MinC
MEHALVLLARSVRIRQSQYCKPGEKLNMSEAQSLIAEKVEELPADLRNVMAAVASLPEPYRLQLEPMIKRVANSTKRRRRILSLVQDALSQLRLDMKYLMVDLEATRRERDEYREQLEEKF